MKKLVLALLLSVNMGAAFAAPTTLNALTNVDNVFNAYISTNDAVQGTWIGSGTDWPTTYSYGTLLTPGVTNYLHVVAVNQGGPGGFLGAFSLSDGQFKFANGTQNLLTGDAGWGLNLSGFGNPYGAAVNEGANGTGPWGLRAGYGSDVPQWIWNYDSSGWLSDFNTEYFTAAINPVDPSGIPEPTSVALMGLGLMLGLAILRKRQS